MEALRLADPASCVAVGRDGTETAISLTGSRNKYERLLRTLATLDAYQCRCLDAAGVLTEVVVLGEQGEAGEKPAAAPVASTEVAALLALVLRAQDAALARQMEAFSLNAAALTEMMRDVTNAAIAGQKITAERAEKLELSLMRLLARRERDAADTMAAVEALAAEAATPAEAAESSADVMMGTLFDLATGRAKAPGANKP
jgi:hypothetical protein